MSAVVVVGSVNVDLIASGGRIPAPGETTTMPDFAEGPGGKGGNQACVAASLGARTYLVGAVGADDRGSAARADLARYGVDVTFVSTVDAPTGVAVVLVDDRGENAIAVVPGANGRLSPESVAAALAAIPEPRAVVVACLEIPVEAVFAAAVAARDRGWPFVLNPAPARDLPAELVELTSVLVPNEHELARLAPLAGPMAGPMVVTRGAAGCDVHDGGTVVHHPAVAASVVDTTGAGDAFVAALAVALASGRTLTEAARWGLAAGAIATEAPGARGSLPTVEALRSRLA